MRTAAKILKIRHGERGWRFIALMLLAAFTLQSYVTQTHIHGTALDSAAVVKVLAEAPAQGGSAPIDKSEQDCPFCQAIVHAGAFFTPAAPILLPPVLWAQLIAPVIAVSAVAAAPAHDWLSRGPPQS